MNNLVAQTRFFLAITWALFTASLLILVSVFGSVPALLCILIVLVTLLYRIARRKVLQRMGMYEYGFFADRMPYDTAEEYQQYDHDNY